MSLLDAVKAFFKTPKSDPVALANLTAYSATFDPETATYSALEPYSARAERRNDIYEARRHSEGPDDERYKAAVAACTDPADFLPYSEVELDAHTAAFMAYDAVFDSITAAFSAFKRTDNLFQTAASAYQLFCQKYTSAARAYRNTALLAAIETAKAQLEAKKDEIRAGWLEHNAESAATAAAAKAKAVSEMQEAEQLFQKAKIAQTNALLFLAKAESAKAKAEEALEPR